MKLPNKKNQKESNLDKDKMDKGVILNWDDTANAKTYSMYC